MICDLLSFPTRRSSDLACERGPGPGCGLRGEGGRGDPQPSDAEAYFHAEGSGAPRRGVRAGPLGDRKSTRLNSSHVAISYAVFCLKKKTKNMKNDVMFY